jgi:bidirectional [NiFe] hydrogenase diaphorase subunit
MKRHRYQHDALIEVLHTAQELFGYLRDDLLLYVARGLKLPPSRAYGVATFYHMFRFTPNGRHTCTICTGTACYVKGADALVAAIAREGGVQPGQTTPDGALSLETARCLGACGLAPVVVFDGEVAGKMTPKLALGHITGWADHGPR